MGSTPGIVQERNTTWPIITRGSRFPTSVWIAGDQSNSFVYSHRNGMVPGTGWSVVFNFGKCPAIPLFHNSSPSGLIPFANKQHQYKYYTSMTQQYHQFSNFTMCTLCTSSKTQMKFLQRRFRGWTIADYTSRPAPCPIYLTRTAYVWIWIN